MTGPVPQERGDELVGAVAAISVVEVIKDGWCVTLSKAPLASRVMSVFGIVVAEVFQAVL